MNADLPIAFTFFGTEKSIAYAIPVCTFRVLAKAPVLGHLRPHSAIAVTSALPLSAISLLV